MIYKRSKWGSVAFSSCIPKNIFGKTLVRLLCFVIVNHYKYQTKIHIRHAQCHCYLKAGECIPDNVFSLASTSLSREGLYN